MPRWQKHKAHKHFVTYSATRASVDARALVRKVTQSDLRIGKKFSSLPGPLTIRRMAPLEARPLHSAEVVRAEASKRFETSERTPMGTMPLSVIWAGAQCPVNGGRGGQGEVNACKEKMKVVKPSIWRSPKPTVASPKLKPASPRSWRTVCGLKCKDVTQDKVCVGRGGGVKGEEVSLSFAQGVHLVVRERAYSTVTEVEREQVENQKKKKKLIKKPSAAEGGEAEDVYCP